MDLDLDLCQQTAFQALEANYENVLQTLTDGGDVETAYNNFVITVNLALELLPDPQHATIREIQTYLDTELAEQGYKTPAAGDGDDATTTKRAWTNKCYWLVALIIFIVILACYYKWKS